MTPFFFQYIRDNFPEGEIKIYDYSLLVADRKYIMLIKEVSLGH